VEKIPKNDLIIIITSRTDEFRRITEEFLGQNGISYDHIIFNAPYGERILINDRKPSGLTMAVAINVDRDKLIIPEIIETNEEEEKQ
jgi:23S rRNA G2445 N2-methylase RlmL